MIDPITGIDDGTGDYGDDPYGLNSSMFLQPQSLPAYSTQKAHYGQPLPFGQPQLNQQLTGATSLMKLMHDPRVLMDAQIATGVPTMDLSNLAGIGQYAGGAAGGAAGGGAGNGYKPIFTTQNLDAVMSGTDPISKLIQGGFVAKKNPAIIKNELRTASPGMSDQELFQWNNLIDSAWKEQGDKARNDLLGQAAGAGQSPIQQWLGKYGYINPIDQFTGQNLPGDINLSGLNRQVDQGVTDVTKQLGTQISSNQASRNALAKAAFNQSARPFGLQPGQGPQPRPTPESADWHWSGIPRGTAGQVPTAMTPNAAVQPGPAWNLFGPQTAPQRGQAPRAAPTTSRMRNLDRERQVLVQQQQSQQGNAADYKAGLANAVAARLQAQGRTPARDAQRAVLNYLRSSGLGV